ncbi:MAG: oligosaccharide flippase family protein [Chloroflexi bacterium]|nr:oligosaccharide flippase family protein [Chloroflexota bacterium]
MTRNLRARLSNWVGDNALKRLIKNASFLFGAEALVTLISAVQFPLVTRWLGAENYGALGIVISSVALVGQLLSFRLWETVIKYFTKYLMVNDEGRALAILKLCLFIDFSMSAIIFAVISLAAGWLAALVVKRPDGADLIRLQAFHALVLVSMSVWMALLRVFDRFKFISAYNVVSAIALFALSVIMLALGGGVAGMIIAATLTNLGQTLILTFLAGRELKSRFRRHWFTADLRSLREDWHDIWVMLFSMNIDTLRKIAMNNADLVVLGWFTTPAQAGVYRLAKQLASYFGRLTNPVYDTLFPEVAKLYTTEGPARVRAMVTRLTRGIAIGLAGSFIGAYLFSGWLVPVIFGSEYIPAIPLFYIILLTNILAIMLWAPSVLLSAGRAKQLTAINTISSLVMLTLLLVLTWRWGSVGTAIALVSFHVTWLSLTYPATRKALAG